MMDNCPKCDAKMWHFFHWLEASLDFLKDKPPIDGGYRMHQINGPTCLHSQREKDNDT